jgi:integrase
MQVKITARAITALKPADKPYEAFDTEIKGFLLRVEPTGIMTYYLAYKTPGGRRGRYRIGRAGNLTPVQARDVALRLAADVAHGKDIQAEKKQARIEAEHAKIRTLRGFLEQKYESWVRVEHRSSIKTLSHIKANFGFLMDMPMKAITPWIMEKWRVEQRKNKKAVTSINRSVAALKAALSKAVEWGILDAHPLAKLKPLKADNNGKIRYLTIAEEKRLREALDRREARIRAERASANEWRSKRGYASLPTLWDWAYADHLKPMVLLSINTGLRRGELFKLTWDNVSFHTKTLTVEGSTAKSGKTRHVPMNAEVLEILRKWKAQGIGTGLVFPGKDGAPMDNIQTSWEGLLKDAGITEFRWHDLRHTFASKLVMAGVDLNTVRELLGHEDIKTTLRYAHLAPEHKAEAVARLSAA